MIRRVLLIYKKSYLELQKDHAAPGHLRRILRAGRARALRSDRENRLTRESVIRTLKEEGIAFDVAWRGRLEKRARHDLIISVGGDGTFLSAAHAGGDTPVMAVNSDPEHSLALFAAADRRTFAAKFRKLLAGRLPHIELTRLDVRINGRPLSHHPQNDVLLAHENPAAMTRYAIRVGAAEEEQKSSGIWFSTAAGSTAAIRTAGGRVMPLASRIMQYRVREPYSWQRPYRLISGIVPGPVRVVVATRRAALYIDGHRISYPVTTGDAVEVRPSRRTLAVYGCDPARRRKLFGSPR